MATELQKKMIVEIAESDYTEVNGARPECPEHTLTWANVVIYDAQDKGVFTSLVNAGLAAHSGSGRDAVVCLTDEGFALYNQIKDGEQ